jgi:translation initiation factor 2 beta subunit (eIF-2beta)/eIF-5
VICFTLIELNIYDTKLIACKDCGKIIGEIDYDTEVLFLKYGQCSNHLPQVKDKMLYLIEH